MRNIIVSEFLSIDGIMEDPGGSEAFEHGGWSFSFLNEEYLKYKLEEVLASDALLLGRVTYQAFAEAWPSRTDEDGFADRMNTLPKYVVSSTLDQLEWNNSRLIQGNVVEEISKLKQQPGQPILVVGSCQLVQTLLQHDLVDELRLMVHPIVLGSGKRLLEHIDKKVMKLIEMRTLETGVVILTYKPEKTTH